MFERTLDHQRSKTDSPQQTPSMHQTPFYVFPTIDNGKLLTLPDGKLMHGLRNAVTSHERNAIQIASNHNLAVRGRGSLSLPRDSVTDGYGFVVEPAWKTTIPEYADLTTNRATIHHQSPLELHNYENLIEILSDQPNRRDELAFVRSFGEFVLTHHV